MNRTDPCILVPGSSWGDSQLVPNDRNAVVGGNSTSKSIASHTTKRTDRTKRGAGARGATVPNGVGQRARGARSAMGEFTVSAAARLLKAYSVQVETLRRLSHGGDQHVRVERPRQRGGSSGHWQCGNA